MQLSFFGQAPVFWTVYLVWVVSEVVGFWRQRSRVGATRRDRGSEVVLVGSIFAGLLLGYIMMGFAPTSMTWQRPVIFRVGIALMLLGMVLRWYAMWVLGALFTRDVAVREGQPVVDRGPYRLIRHPSYSGILLTLLGIGLTDLNWASVVLVVGFSLAGLVYRVRVEEQALLGSLGVPYADYMHRTHRFIPHVL